MTPALAAQVERWRVPIQTGLAAGLSWWIATAIAGHAEDLVDAVAAEAATSPQHWSHLLPQKTVG